MEEDDSCTIADISDDGTVDHLQITDQAKMRTNTTYHGLCSQMCLSEYPNQFMVEPMDGKFHQILIIDRTVGRLHLFDEVCEPNGQKLLSKSIIYGVIGVIHLLAGSYVLVITGREYAGSYDGTSVYRISGMKFLFCNSDLSILTAQERQDEAHFFSLLKILEKTPGLFFSYETDLTLSLQRADSFARVRKSQPLWKQADPRFLWNQYILEEMIECKLEPYILPVIQGSFHEVIVPVKEDHLNITLFARRCNRRLGTRMWRRGADRLGHTANFVETEQILKKGNLVVSYLQIRGSIPLLWEQIVDLTYKPEPKITSIEETADVIERHFHDLSQRYGSIVVVDLLDQHGSEGMLSSAYRSAIQGITDQSIRYVSFDFHKICGPLNFDRLSHLYDEIKEDFSWQGFYFVDVDGHVENQRGAVRVNCVDCLDRTNITQSFLARKALEHALQRIGFFDDQDSISKYSNFDHHFNTLWGEHGDDLSLQYSGTEALKRDFVRYGRRTTVGLLQDGWNALTRYYLNNFQDGSKQDALDLLSGRYTVSRCKPSPFRANGFEAFTYLPLASAIIVGCITLTSSSMARVRKDTVYFIKSVLWAGITAGVIALVKGNGRQFCSRPRLCRLA